MSIIGPRASEWDAVNTFLPDEIDKMKVRPGITGLSQAYYRNSVSPRKKRLLDAWYANNATLIIDALYVYIASRDLDETDQRKLEEYKEKDPDYVRGVKEGWSILFL